MLLTDFSWPRIPSSCLNKTLSPGVSRLTKKGSIDAEYCQSYPVSFEGVGAFAIGEPFVTEGRRDHVEEA